MNLKESMWLTTKDDNNGIVPSLQFEDKMRYHGLARKCTMNYGDILGICQYYKLIFPES